MHHLKAAYAKSTSGTSVAMIGDGFSRRSALLGYTQLRFNTTRVPAVWVSTTELRAVAPRHSAGLVSVELTQNDQQYVGSLRFEYEDATAHSVTPSSGRCAAHATHDKPGLGLLNDKPGLGLPQS